jgi:hypothetical protein
VPFHRIPPLHTANTHAPAIAEKVVFPFLNQKLDFSHEIEQHKTIHAGVDELLPFIRAAKADPAKFDAPRMKEMMQALRGPLVSLPPRCRRVPVDKCSGSINTSTKKSSTSPLKTSKCSRRRLS